MYVLLSASVVSTVWVSVLDLHGRLKELLDVKVDSPMVVSHEEIEITSDSEELVPVADVIQGEVLFDSSDSENDRADGE